MPLKDQLPYLGKEQGDGTLKVCEYITLSKKYWYRPDYGLFEPGGEINELECIEILTGIGNIESCLYEADKLTQMALDKERAVSGKEDRRRRRDIDNPIWIANFLFFTLISNIIDMIGRAVGFNKIKRDDTSNLGGIKLSNYSESFDINPYYYYDTLDFLNLAKRRGYKIPEELPLGKYENGTLYWLNDEINDDTIKNTQKQVINISDIVIEYVDNTEIKITVGKNKTKIINAGALGFALNKGRRAWDIFIEILEHPQHTFYCGKSQTKKDTTEYNKNYNNLRQISKKIIHNFFNKECNLSLPDTYSLFKKVPNEPGFFTPIFKIKDSDASDLCSSKSDFIYKFSRAQNKSKKYPNDINKLQYMIDLIGDAMCKNYICEIEEEKYIKIAKEAAKRIKQIDDNQLDIQTRDPNCETVENMDDYSDNVSKDRIYFEAVKSRNNLD